MVHLSPGLRTSDPYPFEELYRRKEEAVAAGRAIVDFGVGDPRGETPAFIRQALKDAIEPTSSYPRAAGLPELRAAIAAWVERRFGTTLDPDVHILPTLGSKEPIFHLAQALLDPAGGKHLVTVTTPGYAIPERGAEFAGGDVARLSLTEANGFLPDLDAVDASTWDRTSILWLNYPNNPTGATAPRDFLQRGGRAMPVPRRPARFGRGVQRALVRRRAAGLRPAGGGPHERPRVPHAQQAFLDDGLSLGVRRRRPGADRGPEGPPTLGGRDAAGVRPARVDRGVERRDARGGDARGATAGNGSCSSICSPRAESSVAGSAATFYLWLAVPGTDTSLDWSLRLLDEADVLVAPGSFFGPGGEGYVRMAMVPTMEECERAADALDQVLGAAA